MAAADNKRRRALVSMRACRIGLPETARDGWLVFYGGNLLAVLQRNAAGEVQLSVGFEEPFASLAIAWPDEVTARADFIDVARLYRAGVIPAMIEFRSRNGSGGH